MFDYKTYASVDDFHFWLGARDRMEAATPEQRDAVEERIEEFCQDLEGLPTQTQINDLVWFDCDDIFFPDEEEDY